MKNIKQKKCKDCDVPPTYDYAENCSLCGLFGWDNDDEHFKEYADGSEGCIHRKATIDKWYEEYKKAMKEGRFY